MNYRECAKLLKQQDDFLIVTHNNPDGDTVGSAAALCSALRRSGKRAFLYPNPQFNRKQRPLAEPFLAPEGFASAFTVAVDVATEQMLARGFAGKADLCIDHHPTNSHYAAQELIRDEKSACGEIVLELVKALCGDVTKDEASLLYIALTTDTGCYQYDNTNAATLSAGSELLRLGADSPNIIKDFFRKVSPARLRLEGLIYSNMRFYRGGKIAVALITREMLEKSGATEDDFDDLAGLAGRTEGSVVNLTIRELPNGDSKVSVRSTKELSSSAICAAFGGGGHEMAAGCTIAAPPEKAAELLMDVVNTVYP